MFGKITFMFFDKYNALITSKLKNIRKAEKKGLFLT